MSEEGRTILWRSTGSCLRLLHPGLPHQQEEDRNVLHVWLSGGKLCYTANRWGPLLFRHCQGRGRGSIHAACLLALHALYVRFPPFWRADRPAVASVSRLICVRESSRQQRQALDSWAVSLLQALRAFCWCFGQLRALWRSGLDCYSKCLRSRGACRVMGAQVVRLKALRRFGVNA